LPHLQKQTIYVRIILQSETFHFFIKHRRTQVQQRITNNVYSPLAKYMLSIHYRHHYPLLTTPKMWLRRLILKFNEFNGVHHMWVTMQVETDTHDPHMGHDAVKVINWRNVRNKTQTYLTNQNTHCTRLPKECVTLCSHISMLQMREEIH
jgi:hypothetical protein